MATVGGDVWPQDLRTAGRRLRLEGRRRDAAGEDDRLGADLFAGATLNGVPIGGLLGSDVLSRFGMVTLDFAGKRLILGGKAPSGGHTIPVKAEHYKGGKVLVIVRATIGDKTAAYAIDTGSPSAVIESRAATQLGLRAVGKRLTIQGEDVPGVVEL